MGEILYTTVDREHAFEHEEKRSVFIAHIKNVSNDEQAKEFIASVKAKHHDARHNCSAYLLRDGIMRYSDDGEPQGTAGIPILEVIKKSGLVDVVVVVTRYFGGILLGAGGLVRAYSAAASGVVCESAKASYRLCVELSMNIQYPQYDKVSRMISNSGARTVDTQYTDGIVLCAVIPKEDYEKFSDDIVNAFGGKVQPKLLKEVIEKI